MLGRYDAHMKRLRQRIVALWMCLLLATSTGCMSTQAVCRAKGFSNDRVAVSQGDVIFLYEGKKDALEFLVRTWHAIPKAHTNNCKIPKGACEVIVVSELTLLDDLPKISLSHYTSAPRKADGVYYCPEYKPNAAYYCLLPVSVPLDAATLPFQALGFVFMAAALGGGH